MMQLYASENSCHGEMSRKVYQLVCFFLLLTNSLMLASRIFVWHWWHSVSDRFSVSDLADDVWSLWSGFNDMGNHPFVYICMVLLTNIMWCSIFQCKKTGFPPLQLYSPSLITVLGDMMFILFPINAFQPNVSIKFTIQQQMNTWSLKSRNMQQP